MIYCKEKPCDYRDKLPQQVPQRINIIFLFK